MGEIAAAGRVSAVITFSTASGGGELSPSRLSHPVSAAQLSTPAPEKSGGRAGGGQVPYARIRTPYGIKVK